MSAYELTNWLSLAKKIKDNEGLSWVDAQEESKKRLKVGKYKQLSTQPRVQPRAQTTQVSKQLFENGKGLIYPSLLDGVSATISKQEGPAKYGKKGNLVINGPFTILAPIGQYEPVELIKEIKFSSGQHKLKDIITRIRNEYDKKVTTELNDLLALAKKEGDTLSSEIFEDLQSEKEEEGLKLYDLNGSNIFIESFRDEGKGRYSLNLGS